MNDLIERLRELLAKATLAEWQLDEEGDLCARVPTVWKEGSWMDDEGRERARLAVEAVNALLTLLDRIAALEGENERLREMADVDAITGCADDFMPGSAEQWRDAVKETSPPPPCTCCPEMVADVKRHGTCVRGWCPHIRARAALEPKP